MEQYREKNVEYERDIPILQETVGGVWKKEDELKALKAEVAALERKIQLTLAPPKPEAGQEQGDGVQRENEQQPKSVKPDSSDDFIRNHVLVVKPSVSNIQQQSGKNIKL